MSPPPSFPDSSLCHIHSQNFPDILIPVALHSSLIWRRTVTMNHLVFPPFLVSFRSRVHLTEIYGARAVCRARNNGGPCISSIYPFFPSVPGLCGVVESSTTNHHSLGSVCPVLVPGFNRDACDVPHVSLVTPTVLR